MKKIEIAKGINCSEAVEARAAIAMIKQETGIKVEAAGHEGYKADVLSHVPALQAATAALNNSFVTTMTEQFVTLLRLLIRLFTFTFSVYLYTGDPRLVRF